MSSTIVGNVMSNKTRREEYYYRHQSVNRYITLDKGSGGWVGAGCPTLYDACSNMWLLQKEEGGNFIVADYVGFHMNTADRERMLSSLRSFIDESDRIYSGRKYFLKTHKKLSLSLVSPASREERAQALGETLHDRVISRIDWEDVGGGDMRAIEDTEEEEE